MRVRFVSSPFARPIVRRLAGVFALAWACAAAAPAHAGEPSHIVKDPHYGDALYYFYQSRYFTSLTKLMTSQHFERMPHHADEAEVLRGGLYLSYGLHREAGRIFAQLIETTASPAVRDRAWFYLAKIRYQRNLLADAQDALKRIGNHLPPALEEERGLLTTNLLMARGDYAGAVQVLEKLQAAAASTPGVMPDVRPYLRFNLGVALIKSGDTARGSALLKEVGTAPAVGEEAFALRDKANVALGFSALQADRPEPARAALERVRLDGMLANKALLGFGWAAAAMKQPAQALVPWTELARRDASDAAVLEARIALPYAYAELGAVGQALDLYNDVIADFERENTVIDASIATVRSGQMLDQLLAANPGEEMGWFWNIDQLPDLRELPNAGYLAQVLAGHEFQEAFKNYRDLQFLSHNLEQWQNNLGVFHDMLENRRRAFAERLPKFREQASVIGLSDLPAQGALLRDELAGAEAEADGAVFANAQERDLLERIERVRAALDAQATDADSLVARERLRHVSGALTWHFAQEYPNQLWAAKKALAVIDSQLSQSRVRLAALTQAQQDEPARFDRFESRIAELGKRLQALLPRVAELSREQQTAVQELVVEQLEQQKERIAVYANQARYGVAQLQDRATQAKESEHAPAP
ncbi:MAG: hypothetical protein IPJ21_20355 [Sterolibacteriaceae bacterium]|nr:hypothetical protein [Sterolibacteriaceae bacterium]